MANSEAGTSGDAAQALGGEYQVFLSFRGIDTRYNFTDFLYRDLVNAGVRVFRDEDELQEGEVIGDNLFHAINNSILYIPIFSQNYASSKWCLRELALIIDNVSKSEGKKSILPIFLDVEPEDVKLKTPLYSAAFLEHEKKFPDEVKNWRKALEEVDKIKGWNVKKNQSQAEIVESVVKKVLEKLETKQKLVTENLVGLDDRVKYLTELLDVNHSDVRLIAIYGMGGIGKTTIAKVVFNRLYSHFGKCCSFLEDVRESSSTKEGIVKLQEKLLSDVSSGSVEQLQDSGHGMRRIGDTLSTKKVLVVLDDVDNTEHIRKLIRISSLHSGSRIIITTRNKAVVEGFKRNIISYEMLKMDDDLALQLFCQHAFGKYSPPDDYLELSKEIVSCTGGLPLAIEVVGSLLKERDEAFWIETLANVRNTSEEEILKKLRVSYDGLNKDQQQIFLDIACFFYNKNKTDAIYMWAGCQFNPIRGIQVLTERCLIKILNNDYFWMHDQLIALGRQIVRRDDLGEQSRLWNAEEALQIIGTEKTKLNVQALKISRDDPPFVKIRNEDFEKLPNLRILDLNGGTYVGDFAKYHSKLKWFSWSYRSFGKDFRRDNLVWNFRADNLYLDQLVVCTLYEIGFKDDSKAWDLIKRAHKLKVLSIAWCPGITTIPDISRCSSLERLTLCGCSSLKRIESFIGDLRFLIELKIEACNNLTDLPEEIGALVKLKHFSLLRCKELRELPGSIENLTSLTELNLTDTAIGELPNSIGKLKSLRILCFQYDHFFFDIEKDSFYFKENHDLQLPSGIPTLINLEVLNLSGNYRMKGEIPVEIGEWSSLKILKLDGTRICGIPRTINMLHHLHTLNLTNCNEIQELPELPISLTCLLLQSTSLLSVPNLSKLTSLVRLLLSDRSWLAQKSNLIPGCDLSWIGNLSRLKWLELELKNVSIPPELASLSDLEKLVLKQLDLKPLVQLPSSNWNLRNLSTLEIRCCEVEDISLEGLPRLEEFIVDSCVRLQRLSILELRKVQRGAVHNCRELVEIQVVDVSKSLQDLTVDDCESLTRISGLSYLKNLKKLVIEWCNVLTDVEGLNELESLKILVVSGCSSLRCLIDAPYTKIPDDCRVRTWWCGCSIKNSVKVPLSTEVMPLKQYREEILLNTPDKISFTVRFHLGVKKSSEELKEYESSETIFSWEEYFVGGIKKEKEVATLNLVTYEGLIADVKNFGFRLRRMWYKIDNLLPKEIKSDEDVKRMVQVAPRWSLLIDLYVEGGVDSEWEGEYDEEMMQMLTEEQRTKTDVHSDEDGAKGDVSCPNEDSNSAPVGESGTHGASSVDDFELERVEKDLDNVKKQVELHREPRDEEETAGDAMASAILSDSLAANNYSEASTVSEASRWAAEVDELERLLNADV